MKEQGEVPRHISEQELVGVHGTREELIKKGLAAVETY
jgi:hypothetical protein